MEKEASTSIAKRISLYYWEERTPSADNAYCSKCNFHVNGTKAEARARKHARDNLNHIVVIRTYDEA